MKDKLTNVWKTENLKALKRAAAGKTASVREYTAPKPQAVKIPKIIIHTPGVTTKGGNMF